MFKRDSISNYLTKLKEIRDQFIVVTEKIEKELTSIVSNNLPRSLKFLAIFEYYYNLQL